MAARRAVIGSTVGGIPEVIGNEAGLLVPPANPVTLSAAILKLVANPELARQMGERGRQRVQELFTVEATVAKYQELYTRFAGNLHP
jgi:glycosyltransferase involved in cell wall biosynthesis